MKRKKLLRNMRQTLILLNAEADEAPEGEQKIFLNGAAVGFSMAIDRIKENADKITVFEKITESPEALADFILKNPCTSNPAKDCEDGVDCHECMRNYLLSKLGKPAETLNAKGICDVAKG